MKVFFDTEFTGLHKNTTLISIGLISEDGKTFYAELTDYDSKQIDDWLEVNVLRSLSYVGKKNYIDTTDWNHVRVKWSKDGVASLLSGWLSQFEEVEIWSDCLAYDWILFNDLFGHAFNIPENVSYIPMDICTLFSLRNIDPDINREEFAFSDYIFSQEEVNKHNALWDAKIIKLCYEKLMRV